MHNDDQPVGSPTLRTIEAVVAIALVLGGLGAAGYVAAQSAYGAVAALIVQP